MKKTGLIFSLVVVGFILIFAGWFYQRRMSSHQIEQTSRDNQQDDIALAWHQSPPATTTTATTATTATAGEVLSDSGVPVVDTTFADNYRQKLAKLSQIITQSKNLSQQEKDKLLQDGKSLEADYQQLHLLSQQAAAIEKKILSENQATMTEYEQLYRQHRDLWNKLNDNLTNEQTFITDKRQVINSSSALTQEEKQILLQNQDKLDAIEKKVAMVQQQIAAATKTHMQKQEEIFQRIDEVDAANFALWQKLAEDINFATFFFIDD